MAINFTQRFLDGLKASDKTVLHWDSRTPGLGVKVEPSGRRIFFWSRRANKKLHWMRIGEVESITIESARSEASKRNVLVNDWRLKNFVGTPPWQAPQSATLGAIIDEYIERKIRLRAKNPEAAEKMARWTKDKYLSEISKREIAQITRPEVVELHERLQKNHGKFSANKALQMLRATINWSIPDRFIGPNPASGIELFEEKSRDRYLKPDELAKLFQALAQTPDVDLRDFVLLSLWCATRKSDTLSMRWQDLDLSGNSWRVPNPKSGKAYPIPLTPEAIEIIERRRVRAEQEAERTGVVMPPYVFPSFSASGHRVGPQLPWQNLLKAAGLYSDDRELRPRIHDLRRTMGSYQAAQGSSMLIIGKSLGHAAGSSATSVYARLDVDPVRRSMESAAATMSALMPKPGPALLPAPAKKKKAARRG